MKRFEVNPESSEYREILSELLDFEAPDTHPLMGYVDVLKSLPIHKVMRLFNDFKVHTISEGDMYKIVAFDPDQSFVEAKITLQGGDDTHRDEIFWRLCETICCMYVCPYKEITPKYEINVEWNSKTKCFEVRSEDSSPVE